MTLLAHSARPDQGINAQTYEEHVREVIRRARAYGESIRSHAASGSLLVEAVGMAAEFHDLGKLDEENQAVLRGEIQAHRLPVNHTDAGSAYLKAANELPKQVRMLAAWLVHAHHIGLTAYGEENAKGTKAFRDEEITELVDGHLPNYLDLHRQEISGSESVHGDHLALSGRAKDHFAFQLFMRIALGCLADADHGDTAEHYGNERLLNKPPLLRASERLEKLNAHVESLKEKGNIRIQGRQMLYRDSFNSATDQRIYCCDAPVGSGKTFAVMAHLLQAAISKKLRRIIVVLPYTNIITQAVKEYRKAIVLDGEDPEMIVAEHHHRADFQHPNSRRFTQLWQAPIVITTAVQFFETLASNRPSSLRKLHQLPGSGVFIDESHAALPTKLWPLAWSWIQGLAKHWNCHVVMASGSQTRFWELEEFSGEPVELPELITEKTRQHLLQQEDKRIQFHHRQDALNLSELINWILKQPGPRILIANTVQNAAVIALELKKRVGRPSVEHLSTALMPGDREISLKRIKDRLKEKGDKNWTLVATSMVEAGVNISFCTGFREAAGLVNLIQLGGRINRDNENPDCENMIFSFELVSDGLIRPAGAFEEGKRVLLGLFAEDQVNPEMCKEALRREIRNTGMVEELKHQEEKMEFPDVSKEFRVIDSDTHTVIVDDALKCKLRGRCHQKISPREIQLGSVQIWGYRIDDLNLQTFPNYPDVYEWSLDYDDFIGYMRGVLKDKSFLQRGEIS